MFAFAIYDLSENDSNAEKSDDWLSCYFVCSLANLDSSRLGP